MMRNLRNLLAVLVVAVPMPLFAADPLPAVTVYKDPDCSCCGGHVEHLRQQGYNVAVKPMQNMALVKRMYGVPDMLQSCHTATVGGYIVEGHVPARAIAKLLAERPEIRGIALPGMPGGAPGMPGPKTEPFTVYTLQDGSPKVFLVD